MASGPITSWQIDGETVETVSDFIFWVRLPAPCSWERRAGKFPRGFKEAGTAREVGGLQAPGGVPAE